MGARQELLLRAIQDLHQDVLNNRRHDWIAGAGFLINLLLAGLSVMVSVWLVPVFIVIAALFVLWRITV